MPKGAGGQINVGPETLSTAVSAPRVGRAAAVLIICWLRALGLLALFFPSCCCSCGLSENVEAESDDGLVAWRRRRKEVGRCPELRPGPREGADDI